MRVGGSHAYSTIVPLHQAQLRVKRSAQEIFAKCVHFTDWKLKALMGKDLNAQGNTACLRQNQLEFMALVSQASIITWPVISKSPSFLFFLSSPPLPFSPFPSLFPSRSRTLCFETKFPSRGCGKLTKTSDINALYIYIYFINSMS